MNTETWIGLIVFIFIIIIVIIAILVLTLEVTKKYTIQNVGTEKFLVIKNTTVNGVTANYLAADGDASDATAVWLMPNNSLNNLQNTLQNAQTGGLIRFASTVTGTPVTVTADGTIRWLSLVQSEGETQIFFQTVDDVDFFIQANTDKDNTCELINKTIDKDAITNFAEFIFAQVN